MISYSDINNITARTVLITIIDSVYNFRYGRPNESLLMSIVHSGLRMLWVLQSKKRKGIEVWITKIGIQSIIS